MAETGVSNDFVAKHWQHFPEWQVARAFIPEPTRDRAFDWLALQHEWLQADLIEEAIPRQAKLAWWSEELRGWSRGMRRHPLGMHLQAASNRWAELADALSSPLDIRALARAIALVESDWHGLPVREDLVLAILLAEQDVLAKRSVASVMPEIDGSPRIMAMRSAILSARSKRVGDAVSQPAHPLKALLICWSAARKSN